MLRLLWFSGLLGLLSFAHPSLGWTRWFLLFFLAPLFRDLVALRSGGERGFYVRFWMSTGLSLLNPWQFSEQVAQYRGDRAARARYRDTPPAPDSCQQQVRYTLPFDGEWLVVNGGVTEATSHSWDLMAQRYAYDFVIADEDGTSHRGDGRRPEDYLAWQRPILAAADGEVVAVVTNVRDARSAGSGWLDWRARGIGGNSVVIRHADGEFGYSAHLAFGSVRVRLGQQVKRGDVIGRCGHSGHSTEPHLHFQVQDRADVNSAAGLPVRFDAVRVDGQPPRDNLILTAGQRVSR